VRRVEALAALAAASASAIPRRIGAQTAAVRIAGSGTTEPYLVPYYARDEDFFTKAGLNVELIPQPTVIGGVQAVAAGAADVSQGDIIMLANALIGGLPFAIIAGGGIYRATNTPSVALVVTRDAPIRSARDLEGKNMGVVTLKSLTAISGLEWVRRNGGDPSRIRLIELPFAQMPEALTRGNIDAAVAVEPFIHYGPVPLRVLGNIYNAVAPLYLGVFFANTTWLAANADTARRLVATFYETARWANTHPGDTPPLIAKYNGYELDYVRKLSRSEYATSLDPKLMDAILDGAYRYGAIAKPVSSRELIAHT
jgi:NitT/TauT family transport system substrate-binding protein